MALLAGARVIVSDLYAQRLTISKAHQLLETIDASTGDLVQEVSTLTEGRGADAVLLAVGGNRLIPTGMDSVRYGGGVMVFSRTCLREAHLCRGSLSFYELLSLG